MKHYIFFLLTVFLSATLCAQQKVKKDVLVWNGQQISQPYEDIYQDKYGFFHVADGPDFDIDRNIGLINPQGKVILPCEYRNILICDQFIIYQKNDRVKPVFGSDSTRYIVVYSELDLLEQSKYGVIDTAGQEVLPLQYGDIRYAGNNRFFVRQCYDDKVCNKWGMIDANGITILPFVYEELRNISGRNDWLLAEISDDPDCNNYKYKVTNAVIDLEGNVIHSFEGFDVADIGEDILLLNKSGNERTRDRYIKLSMPMGMMPPRIKREYQFVDMRDPLFKPTKPFTTYQSQTFENGFSEGRNRKGKKIIPNNYTYNVSDKYPQLMELYNSKNGKCGVMDLTGKWIVPPFYEDIDFESNDLISVCTRNGRSGIFNIKGKQIMAPTNNFVDIMDDKYIYLEKKNGKEGILDINGKKILPCSYDDIRFPGHGQLVVGKDNKWMKYDVATKQFTPLNYSFIDYFWDGYAHAERDGNKSLILDMNFTIKEITIANVHGLENVGHGRFIYIEDKSGKYGVINAVNKENTVPPVYSHLERGWYINSVLYAKKNGKWGIVDTDNNILISFEYKSLEDLKEAKDKPTKEKSKSTDKHSTDRITIKEVYIK